MQWPMSDNIMKWPITDIDSIWNDQIKWKDSKMKYISKMKSQKKI